MNTSEEDLTPEQQARALKHVARHRQEIAAWELRLAARLAAEAKVTPSVPTTDDHRLGSKLDPFPKRLQRRTR